MANHFLPKPLELLLEEMKRREPAAPGARPGPAHRPRRRRDHRRRHLRARPARRPHNTAGPALMLSYVVAGHHLHLRRALLRRVRRRWCRSPARLHLRLRHAGRAVRLDHRLGPGPRIRRRRGHGGQRLVRLLPERARQVRHRSCRRRLAGLAVSTTTRTPAASSRPASFVNLPAVLIVVVVTVGPGQGHPGERQLQRRMVIIKLAAVLFVIGVGAFYVNPANWHPFAPYGWTGLSFFGNHVAGQTDAGGKPSGCSPGRPSSSSPTSASTRSRPTPRRPRTRSATCRSASSPRCSSARCSTSPWSPC